MRFVMYIFTDVARSANLSPRVEEGGISGDSTAAGGRHPPGLPSWEGYSG